MSIKTRNIVATVITLGVFIALSWISYEFKGVILKAWIAAVCYLVISLLVLLLLQAQQKNHLIAHWAIGLLLAIFGVIIVFEEPLSKAGQVIGFFFVFAGLLERYFHYLNRWRARAGEADVKTLPTFDIVEFIIDESKKLPRKRSHKEDDEATKERVAQENREHEGRKNTDRGQHRKKGKKTR